MENLPTLIRNSDYLKIIADIRQAAKEVYKHLDWGFSEKVYQAALKLELEKKYQIRTEIPQVVMYKDTVVSDGVYCRVDMIVEKPLNKKILIELKSDKGTPASLKSAKQQCLRYLRLTKIQIGMVIVFPDDPNQKVKCRVVSNFPPPTRGLAS